ncbi:hypothetical protein N499_1130 [Wolbachia pipientis wVitA]|nr:hypothetical protein gwv_1130 [Wolbachia phage WO]ONI57212.1 hypothetical protein N499_1130 [Wolbachia pipientis wVitA]
MNTIEFFANILIFPKGRSINIESLYIFITGCNSIDKAKL